MIVMIILGVLVLLFAGVAFMVSKNWRWTHVTLLVGVFLAAISCMVLAAIVLRTQANWRQAHDKLAQQLSDAEARLEQLQVANALSEDPESVPRLQGDLNRLIIDRGRVWRNVAPAPGDGVVDLNLARWGDDACARAGRDEEEEFDDLEPIPADEDGDVADGQPAAGGPTVRKPHHITQGMILHAFLEIRLSQLDETQRTSLFAQHNLPELDTNGACKIPGVFLGSYQVVQAGDVGISVEAIDDISPTQAALMGQSTWALYEVMPADSHTTLEGFSPEAIQALFAFATKIAESDDETLNEVGQAVAEFVRDRQPADSSDPDERTMIRVKFTQDHSIEVDVEEAEAGLDKGNFDFRGRAQVAELQQGAPIEFKQGDLNYFDAQTAKRLRDSGVVEFVEEPPLYLRELRDYSYLFTERNAQVRELQREMNVLRDQQAAIVNATEKAQEQIAYRQQEIEKLNQDLAQFQAELTAIKKLKTDMAQYRSKQLQTLSFLYHNNLQLRGAE